MPIFVVLWRSLQIKTLNIWYHSASPPPFGRTVEAENWTPDTGNWSENMGDAAAELDVCYFFLVLCHQKKMTWGQHVDPAFGHAMQKKKERKKTKHGGARCIVPGRRPWPVQHLSWEVEKCGSGTDRGLFFAMFHRKLHALDYENAEGFKLEGEDVCLLFTVKLCRNKRHQDLLPPVVMPIIAHWPCSPLSLDI